MKKIFLCVIALLPLMAMAQQQPEPFEIKSTVGHLNNPARAYLIYQLGANRVVDSAEITAGNFDFKGNILNPTPAIIVIDPFGKGLDKLDTSADNLNFYIDKGVFAINGKDSIARAQITGSKINDDNKKLMGQLKPIIAKAQDLNAEKNAASPAQLNSAEFQNAMNARQKELQVEQRAVLKIFISTNPDSYLSLLALYSVGGPSPDPSEIDPLYNSLSDRIKNMEAARRLKSSLDALRATAIGTIAPDFTQNDVNGVPIKLSSFRGKYVLVDFWASWCGPCRQENPNVVKAYTRFKDKNFTIIGVSLDKPDGKNAWLAAIQNDNLFWTQVSDLKFWNNEVAALYKVTSIPANFLIGPDGKIIAKNLRGNDLENKLQEILGN
jgi:peroxiredoxin